ncbi:unnamed protein product [Blepharisma stoltei]|uniref:EF-hand domain-containing protein n=1 Tax=Blepharisma stoltei TaxID=1481888 RepID=A0AAU9JZE4_9CILI|nr:unnamed protein product [Blepharisma stoltei]
MVEQSILHQGLLSQEEIEEIHRVFVMVDTDGSGFLTMDKIRQIATALTHDINITAEEAYFLHTQLDSNRDGQVTWDDFLEYVCKWLHEHGAVRSKLRTDLPNTISEREALHKAMAQLFSLNHKTFEFNLLPTDSLENRTETWDYLGEGQVFTEIEKQTYYNEVSQKLIDDMQFLKLVEQIFHTDVDIILSGLQNIRDMLGVLAVYQTPNDRMKISPYLLKLFEQLINHNVIIRCLQCLNFDTSKNIQWEALKIITFFAPGPRIPELPEAFYLHPCQKFTKKLIMQTGSVPKILELCESECIEVRDQALLAIGFMSRHDFDIRDYILSLGALPLILRILMRGTSMFTVDLTTIVRAAWVLSILCGATMPREYAKPSFRQQELVEIADVIVQLFQVQEEENLLTNSLIALSFVLPFLAIDEFNRRFLDRLVALLSNPKISVKRAALQTIRNIIWVNAGQCQLLAEAGLFARLSDLLFNSGDSLVKLDTCNVMRYLIQKGYTWEIVNLSRLSSHLQYLIASDPEVRWEAVRIIKMMIESNSRMAVEDMARTGVIRTIFQHLMCFREISPIIYNIYGVNCVTYNFAFLHDCVQVLEKFLILGWPTGDLNMSNIFAQYFTQDEATKLFEVVKILIEEVKKGSHDLYQVNHGEVNLEASLSGLLEKFIKIYQAYRDDRSRLIVDYLTNVLTFFKTHLHQANYFLLVQNQITAETILNCVQTYHIKCMEADGYPNGDNRLLQNLKKDDLNYFTLKRMISNAYGFDKNLEFIDSRGDKITINNQEVLQHAVFLSVQQSFEEYLKSLQSLQKPIPSPLILPYAEIKLIVSGYNYQLPNFSGITSPGRYDWISQLDRTSVQYGKEAVIRDLQNKFNISIQDLESIYNEFFNYSIKKGGQECKVTFQDFSEIIRKIFPRAIGITAEIFNALDLERTGYVDYKNFIIGLNVLRNGTIEQRLWFAFRAHDLNGNSAIERDELFNLLKSASASKSLALTDDEIASQVRGIFDIFDRDKDGKMSFEEFKSAVSSQYITLHTLWIDPMPWNLGFAGYSDMVPCIQCGKKYTPRGPLIPGRAKRCDECTISSPTRQFFR